MVPCYVLGARYRPRGPLLHIDVFYLVLMTAAVGQFTPDGGPEKSGGGAVRDERGLPQNVHARLANAGCYGMLRSATVPFMKIRTITQRELRNDSGAVLREVEAGRTIIVSRNGTPVGELRPIRRRRFVPRATIVDASAHAARIDAGQFRADLDAVVDPHPHG